MLSEIVMHTLKLIVFDVAGTTVSDDDNAVAGRVCDALRAAGVTVAEADVDSVMGMPKPLGIRTLLERARGSVPDIHESQRIHAGFQRRMIEHYRSAATVRALPGAEELFAVLRERGVAVALDTGFDRLTLDTIIARLGWADQIDVSVASDEVEHGRPAPDMIRSAMAAVGVDDARQVGKVGDSVSDIEQGIAAGCGMVAAVLSARTRPVIDQYPGVHPIGTLGELIPIIDQIETRATI